MSTTLGNVVVGIFDNCDHAHLVINELRAAGFRDAELGVLTSFHRTFPHGLDNPIPFVDEEKVEVSPDATTGARVSGVVGSIGALTLATLMIPGFGPMLVGGFFAMLGLGMVGGAMAGGLICSLVGIGVPERHTHQIEQAILAGRPVVSVRTAHRQQEAAAIMDRNGAVVLGGAR